MLTDFLLALVAVGLAIPLLVRFRQGGDTAVLCWALAFLSTAAAAVIGGIYHGRQLYIARETADQIWRVTVLATLPVGFFLLLAGAFTIPVGFVRGTLIVVAVVKAVTVLWILRRSASFVVVTIDAGLSLLVLALMVIGAMTMGEVGREGFWLLAGVGAAGGGAAVQQMGLGKERPFDHNDIFHLAQALACWLFYRGVMGG